MLQSQRITKGESDEPGVRTRTRAEKDEPKARKSRHRRRKIRPQPVQSTLSAPTQAQSLLRPCPLLPLEIWEKIADYSNDIQCRALACTCRLLKGIARRTYCFSFCVTLPTRDDDVVAQTVTTPTGSFSICSHCRIPFQAQPSGKLS